MPKKIKEKKSKVHGIHVGDFDESTDQDRGFSRRKISIEDWFKEAESLFGTNRNDWKFECPNCHNIQSINSVLEHNKGDIEVNEELLIGTIYFNCEGRLNRKYGCDWSLGGLFQLHKTIVIFPRFNEKDEKIGEGEMRVFEFAKNNQSLG